MQSNNSLAEVIETVMQAASATVVNVLSSRADEANTGKPSPSLSVCLLIDCHMWKSEKKCKNIQSKRF